MIKIISFLLMSGVHLVDFMDSYKMRQGGNSFRQSYFHLLTIRNIEIISQ
jgi:hypothetical protein